MYVGGEGRDDGGEDKVKVVGNEFGGAVAGGNYGAAGVVGFVNFGEEIDGRGAGSGDDEVGGGGWESGGRNELADGGGDESLVGGGGIRGKGAVEGGVKELAESFL